MKKIELKARYGLIHHLEHIAGDCWQLKCDPKSTGTYRCIWAPGEYATMAQKLKAIDPEGGPFMSVGDKIEDYTITDIMSNGVIWMKKDEATD